MKKLYPILFSLLAIVFFVPVAATIILSFKTGFGGYADLLFNCFVFYPMFWNSVIYAAVITLVQLTAVVPQIRVCIFAVVLFVFADSWNTVEQPMLFLKNDELKTLSVFISNAQNYAGEVLFPAAVIFLIPVLILYLFFSENLEKGLTLGELS